VVVCTAGLSSARVEAALHHGSRRGKQGIRPEPLQSSGDDSQVCHTLLCVVKNLVGLCNCCGWTQPGASSDVQWNFGESGDLTALGFSAEHLEVGRPMSAHQKALRAAGASGSNMFLELDAVCLLLRVLSGFVCYFRRCRHVFMVRESLQAAEGEDGLDLSWSMSGMSISGSVGVNTTGSPGKPNRRRHSRPAAEVVPTDDLDGMDGSSMGLEVIGKPLIPKLGLVKTDEPPGRPAGSAVAYQLQQISESYRVGLISPEEKAILKDNLLAGRVRVSGRVIAVYTTRCVR
jgi:hypothetical protein